MSFFIWYEGKVPSVNRYYRHLKNGGHYISPEGRIFKTRLGWEARRAGIKSPLDGWVSIEIEWHCKARCRGGDLDNRAKAVMDALEKIAYKNDYYVVELTMRKVMDSPYGEGVLIRIRKADPPSSLFGKEIEAAREYRDEYK